ncbi:recombination mediator RecR [Asticcacaulis excentricus]|uniref:Recombination protein RecR n=1 Tax=Asticcacaulis excentricus TaxID=78587 RepID=A0A3G9FWW0_9CAUL|nr:recombination mediator RecR [Asticcacaulis excentricus]BBF79602.1 recombination protein RecR [Asticcacaulis excentricus]
MASGAGPEIERLMALLSKLPGLGPRSARRAALALLKKREQLLIPLTAAMQDAAERVTSCHICGALATRDPCATCADPARDAAMICVVEEDSALWAMERVGAFSGRYHVLGGLLSALDGVRPEDLRLSGLMQRVSAGGVEELVMALPATVEGQTTAHYIADRVKQLAPAVTITHLARGVPVGGELDWLDDGTIAHAFRSRR